MFFYFSSILTYLIKKEIKEEENYEYVEKLEKESKGSDSEPMDEDFTVIFIFFLHNYIFIFKKEAEE